MYTREVNEIRSHAFEREQEGVYGKLYWEEIERNDIIILMSQK